MVDKTTMADKITITQLPSLEGDARPESGPMQFGDDWPGIFIRGDLAFGFNSALSRVFDAIKREEEISDIDLAIVQSFSQLLVSCKV